MLKNNNIQITHQIIKAIKLVFSQNYFSFLHKIYQPEKGVAMELPKKGKVRGWGLYYSTEALWLIVLLTPKGVPSFISRGAAHQRRTVVSASEGRNYRWNLANNPVIHVSC
jgi:hypothetical protein